MGQKAFCFWTEVPNGGGMLHFCWCCFHTWNTKKLPDEATCNKNNHNKTISPNYSVLAEKWECKNMQLCCFHENNCKIFSKKFVRNFDCPFVHIFLLHLAKKDKTIKFYRKSLITFYNVDLISNLHVIVLKKMSKWY